MNSLLLRQIRKYLREDLKDDPDIKIFIEAINKSYHNYEEQQSMLQRAMSISSQELFDANQKLREEAEQQRKVIASLTDSTRILESISVTYKKESGGNGESKELDGIELANLIEKQALQISKIEGQRERILKDLERSNKELKDYAQVVSHDLKSPLRNINTLINWIKEDSSKLDQTTNHNLDLIDKNIEKMDNLINGILEYSVINKKDNSATVIDLNEVVEDIIHLIHVPENTQIIIDEKLPVLKSDRHRLQQLFQNLLSNAVSSIDKEKGIINIGVQEQQDYWQFYIKDNGKGIPKKYHEKIFQIFQSIDNDKESRGIGLSIVQKIIDFYGGKIWLTSESGIGTTFYFTLKKQKS
ncbi:sensor histidine kinase [Aquimarina sp. 2201CG5-10]|uniref:sensor histidine kinase n=1 Tax=Aquimarina callyspongiae TaxID=3098150 RepID=UPI002AB4CA40|nr:ATP-binding protein [Aquimarina sp. 2201CG5-10]MDY8134638.1 ATP-binding protein [Aquimarina sp. 2201CG5-10]